MACMLACSLVHEGEENPALSRIQVIQNNFGSYPEDLKIAICRQCVNPLCVDICPVDPKACYVDTDNGNVRIIDEAECSGCLMCIKECPYVPHRTIWNPEKNVAMKCDLCLNAPHWSEEGGPSGRQACVEICPANAIKLVNKAPTQLDNIGYDINLRKNV